MKKSFFLLIVFIIYSSARAQLDTKGSGSSTASLLQASAISVTIGGDFFITGTFPASITERVDQFVTRMYNEAREKALRNLTDPLLLEKINKKLKDFSLRNITLKRADGSAMKIDLLKFRITGDFKDDPYLKNDDVIIFPPADLKHNFFSISGAVNHPGKFLFVDGDKLSDALLFAQGINKAYVNVTKAAIYRLSYNGDTMNVDTVDINSDVNLQRGDRVVVLAKETEKKEFSILVAGEVNSPGKIPITRNNTTLKQVIERAGGLKSDAFLPKARLYRGNALPLLLETEYGIKLQDETEPLNTKVSSLLLHLDDFEMLRLSNLTEEDTMYFNLENQLRNLLGGSGINFTKINDDNSEASKYIVHDGDIVIIPPQNHSVYVFGQVVKPGNIPYEPGKGYKFYIEKAGGLGNNAQSDIMVIKAGSRDWLPVEDNNVKIEAGDYIYIPQNPVRSFHYYVREVGGYLGIVSSFATILLLLIQFSKL